VSLIWLAPDRRTGLGPWIVKPERPRHVPLNNSWRKQSRSLGSRRPAPIPFSQRLPSGGPRRPGAVKALTRLLRSRSGPSGDCAASTWRSSRHGLRRRDPALCPGIARRSPWLPTAAWNYAGALRERICLRAQPLTRNSPCERGRCRRRRRMGCGKQGCVVDGSR